MQLKASASVSIWNDKSAVTADQVVIIGGTDVIALLAIGNTSDGSEFEANDRKETLSSTHGITSAADSPGPTSGGSTGGGNDDIDFA